MRETSDGEVTKSWGGRCSVAGGGGGIFCTQPGPQPTMICSSYRHNPQVLEPAQVCQMISCSRVPPKPLWEVPGLTGGSRWHGLLCGRNTLPFLPQHGMRDCKPLCFIRTIRIWRNSCGDRTVSCQAVLAADLSLLAAAEASPISPRGPGLIHQETALRFE